MHEFHIKAKYMHEKAYSYIQALAVLMVLKRELLGEFLKDRTNNIWVCLLLEWVIVFSLLDSSRIKKNDRYIVFCFWVLLRLNPN